MPPTNPRPIAANRLLSSLSIRDRRRILTRCESVELKTGEILYERGTRIRYVYFPLQCVIALVAPMNDSDYLGLGLVGSEGMVGATISLGVEESPMRAVVQCPGSVLRIDSALFGKELRRCAVLQREILRYIYADIYQTTQAAACNHFHGIVARLARWLLMTKQRTQSDRFLITHEFLAGMLGVSRVAVSKSAGLMQALGLISYRRGKMTLLDPNGLEEISCGCYGMDHSTNRVHRVRSARVFDFG